MSGLLPTPRARLVTDPVLYTGEDAAEVVWFHLDGRTIGLRPIHPEDKDELLEGFAGLSEESRYRRFLSPTDRLTPRQVAYLTEVDQVHHFAWVAGRLEDAEMHGVGLARYVSVDDETELAVAVTDEAQGHGLGTLLVDALVAVAAARGMPEIFGLVLSDNEPMLSIFRTLEATFTRDDGAIVRATVELPAPVHLGDDAVRRLVEVADRAAGGA